MLGFAGVESVGLNSWAGLFVVGVDSVRVDSAWLDSV